MLALAVNVGTPTRSVDECGRHPPLLGGWQLNANRAEPNSPNITENGFCDLAQVPIDSVLKQALGDDRREFQSAVSLLRSMYNYDRKEAGVFLIGLLLSCGDNWEKRRAIATALYDVQTEGCVNVLVGELKRVKSKNSTRRYLNEVIDVLSCMPPPLVLPGLEELVADGSLTPWMRAKVESALGDLAYRHQHGYP